jgi:hypothetical protein
MRTDTIEITRTAAKKAGRYLTPAQLRTVLREHTGYVCTRSSPNHEGLYSDTDFIMRGEFFGHSLDIVFVVEPDHLVVVTQMSQHNDSLRGRFYEYVGETAADAIDRVRSES